MVIVEKVKDIRDTSIIRNSLNIQKVADNIKLLLENIEELNHKDYDYISFLLNKSLTMLSVTNYILEHYLKK